MVGTIKECFFQLNKTDEAIKAYNKAIEINPQNSGCLVQ